MFTHDETGDSENLDGSKDEFSFTVCASAEPLEVRCGLVCVGVENWGRKNPNENAHVDKDDDDETDGYPYTIVDHMILVMLPELNHNSRSAQFGG